MVRYEGMDELLRRVAERMKGAAVRLEPAPPSAPPAPTPGTEEYASAVEAILHLRRDVEELQALLSPEALRLLTPEQHEDLLALLGGLLQQLWGCESALQRAAPYD